MSSKLLWRNIVLRLCAWLSLSTLSLGLSALSLGLSALSLWRKAGLLAVNWLLGKAWLRLLETLRLLSKAWLWLLEARLLRIALLWLLEAWLLAVKWLLSKALLLSVTLLLEARLLAVKWLLSIALLLEARLLGIALLLIAWLTVIRLLIARLSIGWLGLVLIHALLFEAWRIRVWTKAVWTNVALNEASAVKQWAEPSGKDQQRPPASHIEVMQTANSEQEIEDDVRDQQHQPNEHGKDSNILKVGRLNVVVIRVNQAKACQQCDTKSDDRINSDPNLHPPELRTGYAVISVETARKRELDSLEKSYHDDIRILNNSDIAQPLKRLWALLHSYGATTFLLLWWLLFSGVSRCARCCGLRSRLLWSSWGWGNRGRGWSSWLRIKALRSLRLLRKALSIGVINRMGPLELLTRLVQKAL